jgi:hypothetical protein
VAASFASVGSIITAEVWPIGVAILGSRIYFYFMAINLASVPVVMFLYPETKRQSLESIEHLFGENLYQPDEDQHGTDENQPLIGTEQTEGCHKDDVATVPDGEYGH